MLVFRSVRFERLSVCLLVMLLVSLCGCASDKPFRMENLAKGDIAFVGDIHIRRMDMMLRQLTSKLYRRNPRHLPEQLTIEQRQNQLFSNIETPLVFEELYQRKSSDAIDLAFNENFKGDRVFAFMVGVSEMVRRSYGYNEELFLTDSLDQQGLYNCARNLEIALWRLKNKRDANGQLFILSNSQPGERRNLSYERLFGKMIATQDNMAEIVADRTNRTITKVVQKVATAVFLPI